MATCTVGGRTLAYERRGPGPPLVVLNGFAATKDDWDPGFLAALEAGREVIRVDHRGMGGSEGDGAQFEIEDLAADAAGVIATLGLERPDVLGWSMGGFVALALALAEPERVGRLVLLSTGAGGPTRPARRPRSEAKLSDLSGTPREQASRLISLLFLPRPRADDRRGLRRRRGRRARCAADRSRAGAVAGDGGMGARPGARRAWAGSPRRPWWRPAARTSSSRRPTRSPWPQGMPGAWLARFPHSGHGFMADHPESLTGLISTFLGVD